MNRMMSAVSKTLLGAAACVAIVGQGSTAHADASCNTLLANARAVAARCIGCVVMVKHATNFFTPPVTSPIDWWIGYDSVGLSNSAGHLVGTANRLFDIDKAGNQPFDINQPAQLTYDIDPSGKLTFNTIFGPTDPVCYFDRFMVIVGSGSIETFSFDI